MAACGIGQEPLRRKMSLASSLARVTRSAPRPATFGSIRRRVDTLSRSSRWCRPAGSNRGARAKRLSPDTQVTLSAQRSSPYQARRCQKSFFGQLEVRDALVAPQLIRELGIPSCSADGVGSNRPQRIRSSDTCSIITRHSTGAATPLAFPAQTEGCLRLRPWRILVDPGGGSHRVEPWYRLASLAARSRLLCAR